MCAEVAGVSEGAVLDYDLEVIEASIQEEAEVLPEIEEKPTQLSHLDELKRILVEGGKRHEVYRLMKALYGRDLVERVIQTGVFLTWPDRLERSHCLILLGTIGHSITLEDLEQCFAELYAGDTTRAILKEAQISYLRMWWSGSVKGLPPYWLNHLIDLFRNPLQLIDPQSKRPLGEELLELGIYKTRSLSYTYYDYAIKELVKQGDHSRPEFYFSHRELLAKFVGYAHPDTTREGMIIPVFDEKTGALNYYTLKGQVHHSGLHGYFLTPLDRTQDLPAQLIFRGTDCSQSTHRDLDPSGVGKRSFDECCGEIQAFLTAYVREAKHPKIEMIGHSLGAADAQRALINAVDPENASFFEEVVYFGFCSPKLDTKTIDRWHELLEALEAQEKKPRFVFNFAYHERDLVTWTGDAHISGNENVIIPSNYLVVKSDSGIRGTPEHHTAPFFNFGNFNFDLDNRSFEFYQSMTVKELEHWIEKLEELQNTSSWYLMIKSWFVHVDTIEDCERRIEELREDLEKLKGYEEEAPSGTWIVWSALQALNYTLQPIAYHTFGWFVSTPRAEPQS